MFKIYFWIDGESFDADSFQAGLEENIRGSLEVRRRMNNGTVETFGRYWKSVVWDVTVENPETELVKLISIYENEIQQTSAASSVRIVAEMVYEVASDDGLAGFYFSAEALSLFARLGINLDIDIVRRTGDI
jgi:hypothetical protein